MSMIEDTRDLLEKLIAFPTVSTDSNLAMITFMAEYLERLGARVDIYHDETLTKANLFATLGPEGEGGLMLSGHSDVVPVEDQDWSFDPFMLHEQDGLLYGRGACDMKGFIACTLAMAPAYAEAALRRPLHFAFTHDEETGCLGAQALVEELKQREIKPSMAIIGEPTEMRVIEGHKGCCEYSTRFTGLEGHGSAPERGVNAVEYSVRYATRLIELREALKYRAPSNSRFEPPYTTLNIGRIAGGVTHNVISGKAEVDWEFRPVQQSDHSFLLREIEAYANDVLLPAMRAVDPSSRIETETIGEIAGLTPMDENSARDLCCVLTGANGADVVAFGTEAGLFQSLDMSAVVCGPGSIEQAHKPDEYVSLIQLKSCLSMLHGLTPYLT